MKPTLILQHWQWRAYKRHLEQLNKNKELKIQRSLIMEELVKLG